MSTLVEQLKHHFEVDDGMASKLKDHAYLVATESVLPNSLAAGLLVNTWCREKLEHPELSTADILSGDLNKFTGWAAKHTIQDLVR